MLDSQLEPLEAHAAHLKKLPAPPAMLLLLLLQAKVATSVAGATGPAKPSAALVPERVVFAVAEGNSAEATASPAGAARPKTAEKGCNSAEPTPASLHLHLTLWVRMLVIRLSKPLRTNFDQEMKVQKNQKKQCATTHTIPGDEFGTRKGMGSFLVFPNSGHFPLET